MCSSYSPETAHRPLRKLAELPIQTCLDLLKLLCPRRSLIPWLQSDKEERVITGPHVAQQTEADDAGGILDARCVSQDFFNVSCSRIRAFQRSRVRQLHIDKGIALVLVGQKA